MVNSKQFKKWLKERNEAARSYDVDVFKAFYNKWKARGFYQVNLPADELVIEITMRKMVYHISDTTEEEKAEAKAWLEERGYTTDVG